VRTEGDALLAHSPDRRLAVRLSEAKPGEEPHGAVSTETLASGFELRHATEQGEITGILDLGGSSLFVEAGLDGSAWLSGAGGARSGDELDRYRPALSELLESVCAE